MLEMSTIAAMIIILGITWGALFFLVNKAYRKEKKRTNQGQNG